ncbi:MAG: EAL domain-containing protein [Acidimicrobiales bacterium]|jgi:diguanylate cyclase (GGDEF)-like protein
MRASLTPNAEQSRDSPHNASRSIRTWGAIAAIVVVLGSVSSIIGANAVDNAQSQRIHKDFLTSSLEIGSTLKLELQGQRDLIGSAESFLVGDPKATQAQFTRWSKDVRVLQRYGAVTSLGVLEYVTAAELPAYAKRVSAQQATPFHVEPPGKRPYYCLAPVGITRPGSPILTRDLDVCGSGLGPIFLAARDGGTSAVLPYTYDGVHTVALETPIYEGGGVPTTRAARERTFIAIIALTLLPKVILTNALIGHPDTAVALHYGGAHSSTVFQGGVAPRNAGTATVNLHDGWTIDALGVAGGGGLWGDDVALAILFGGIALSLLVGALIFQLGSERSRLRMLVHERTQALHFQATHDTLTGLPNRALIIDRIDQLLVRNRRRGTLGAALYVDLDDFKNVNDSLGHAAGDRLLILVAERMKAAIREADTIGRMGGDEFVILIDGGDDVASADVVAQRLLEVMRRPFDLSGSLLPLLINTSIGIAVGDRPSGSEFLRDADVALYEAKSNGKNKYVFFNPKMEEEIGERVTLEHDLRSALAERQFHLVYQPFYTLSDLTMVGVEALLRWEHPTRGFLESDEFVPILERTGQIREVGAWVLKEACTQMAAWHKDGGTLDLSVNVSGHQFDEEVLIIQLREALRVSGLSAGSLNIEVTERTLGEDTESIVAQLQNVRALGVRVAIDDFGTGYSSLSSLRQFPVDTIKIDKSFTKSMTTSPKSRALVMTFIHLGRDLGLNTLVEGVESFEEMDLLRDTDLTMVQGYLFSRPLDANALEAQLLVARRDVNSSKGI